jgi:eukaryotic-like serine/threonine-protein kinase
MKGPDMGANVEHIQLGTDRYRLIRRLGQGAGGVVYEAVDRHRHAPVALKLLTQVQGQALLRFKHEFRALADVAHENLVSLYELTATDGCWFFTMELLRGVDFHCYLLGDQAPPPAPAPPDRRADTVEETHPSRELAGDFTPRSGRSRRPSADLTVDAPLASVPLPAATDYDRLRRAFIGLIRGVQALHACGHLHRDIKPTNVMVTSDDRVVLLDFGVIAELSGSRWGGRGIVGTPAYMAPEQATCDAPSPAVDWYAVGVMLYHALTGQRPFSGTINTLLTAKCTRDPRPPRKLRETIPDHLAQLCMDLLQRDPHARPGGDEILRRLGAAYEPIRSTSSDISLAGGVAADVTLIGRRAELARLEQLFAVTQHGSAQLVLIGGRSGMGKTALARGFLRSLSSQQNLLVFEGRCYEREDVPFKAIDGIVDDLSSFLRDLPAQDVRAFMPRDVTALTQAFPVLNRVGPFADAQVRRAAATDEFELRRRALASLRDLFGRIAERAAMVLFIDDLQWGDGDSAQLFDALFRPPDAPAALLLATYREEEAEHSALLQALHDAGERQYAALPVHRIAVEPLPLAAATELATAALAEADMPVDAAPQIAREAQGSPFFVRELVRYLESVPDANPSDLTLESVIAGRIGGLPPASRTLLEVTALAGKPLPRNVAAEAARC